MFMAVMYQRNVASEHLYFIVEQILNANDLL